MVMTNTAPTLNELRIQAFQRILTSGMPALEVLGTLSFCDTPRDILEVLIDEFELAAPPLPLESEVVWHTVCTRCDLDVERWDTEQGPEWIDRGGCRKCPDGKKHRPAL